MLGLDIVLIPSVGFGVLEVGVCLLGFCGKSRAPEPETALGGSVTGATSEESSSQITQSSRETRGEL